MIKLILLFCILLLSLPQTIYTYTSSYIVPESFDTIKNSPRNLLVVFYKSSSSNQQQINELFKEIENVMRESNVLKGDDIIPNEIRYKDIMKYMKYCFIK